MRTIKEFISGISGISLSGLELWRSEKSVIFSKIKVCCCVSGISVKHAKVKSTSINYRTYVPVFSECAPRSVHLHLCVGAVPVGTSPSGDAGQHRGEGRGGECEETHTLKHTQQGRGGGRMNARYVVLRSGLSLAETPAWWNTELTNKQRESFYWSVHSWRKSSALCLMSGGSLLA